MGNAGYRAAEGLRDRAMALVPIVAGTHFECAQIAIDNAIAGDLGGFPDFFATMC